MSLVVTRGALSGFFHELTRRIPNKKWDVVEKELRDCAVRQNGLFFAEYLKGCSATIISPYCALSALEQQAITIDQFVTHQNLWAQYSYLRKRMSYPKIDVIPLFNEDQTHNLKAKAIIRSTLHFLRPGSDQNIDHLFYLNSYQLDELFERMRTSPHSERCIYHFKDIVEPVATVSREILNRPRINFLSRPLDENKNTLGSRILPTHSLVVEFFKMKFGENAILPHPVIGPSTLTDIKESQRLGTRDLTIPFPELTMEIADSFYAPGFDSYYHDLYHIDMASNIGKLHVRAFIELADLIESIWKRVKKEHNITNLGTLQIHHIGRRYSLLNFLRFTLIDMEHYQYRPHVASKGSSLEYKMNNDALFWRSIFLYLGARGHKIDKSFPPQIFRKLQKWGVYRDIAHTILVTEKEKWEALGVSQKGLQEEILRVRKIEKNSFLYEDIDDNFSINLIKQKCHPTQYLDKATA